MIEHNGDQFKYILTIAETGLTPKNVEISDWQKANYTMNTNNIFTAYNITIKAHNEKGDSTAELKPIIGYSGEDSKCKNNIFYTTNVHSPLHIYYTPRNEVRGGYTGITLSVRPSVRLSVRPSVCRRARLGKIARLGIGCRGGYFVPLGQPHSSFKEI